jgi:hypothetical protein
VIFFHQIFIEVIKSRRMIFAWHLARIMGEWRGVYRGLVGKPEGKRPLARPRPRLEGNIKMYLQEVEWGLWIGSSWLRIGTFGVSIRTFGFYKSRGISSLSEGMLASGTKLRTT